MWRSFVLVRLGLFDGLRGLLHVALVPEGRQKGAGDGEQDAEVH
jgi:hypothetical protein